MYMCVDIFGLLTYKFYTTLFLVAMVLTISR